MICPQCQDENTDGARFCRTCGTALQYDDPTEHPATPYRPPMGGRLPPLPHGGFADIIDLTFTVYGGHFWPFVLIALVPQAPALIGELAFLATENELISVVILVVTLVVGILMGGAVIHAVGRHFLGRPVLVQRSYEYAWARFPALLGASVMVILTLVIPVVLSFILIGIPVLVFLIVVFLFVTQAVVIEQRDPIDAMKRSWNIVRGAWWRACGVTLGVVLAIVGFTVLQVVVLSLIGTINQILAALARILLSTLVVPLPAIVFTLLYFDLRVGKEQYTHDDLARELGELP